MKNIGVKYGVIFGLVLIIAQTVGNLLEIQASGSGAGIISWVAVFAVTFYIIFMACKEFREEHGDISIGEGLKMGVTCSLIGGIIGGVFSLIYLQLIDTDFAADLLETMRDQWEEQGLDDAAVAQAEKMFTTMTNPALTIPFSVLFYVVGGLIKGPIAGAILRRS